MKADAQGVKGRGAAGNPPNRFETIRLEPDPDRDPAEDPAPHTVFLRDVSRTVISRNESPDVPFEVSLNPYRGCEHGCAYCYARPTHEYLGFSAGLDFETRILVKEDAPDLLRRELASPKWRPAALTLSGVTDPYQPVERRLQLTRRCLQVLAECRHPVAIITKNHLVTRDLDLLGDLARLQAAFVAISLPTLKPELAAAMEPRASLPALRLDAIRRLTAAGIPTGVLVAPVVPGLTDPEIPAILQAAADAGASFAARVLLRLPHAVAEVFSDWLERHLPLRRTKVLNAVKSMRGGRLNEGRFGARMRGEGSAADRLEHFFAVACRRTGLTGAGPTLSTDSFRRPPSTQLELF
ncbi:MAG: PA0069 family radical SAM protein [Verrucomicrobiales bacterium]|nr:PA0069 family radical SAM protein [Verrucomicrobiales bacterium]